VPVDTENLEVGRLLLLLLLLLSLL